MSREEIEELCEEYRMKNYTINSDGSIDVNGHLDLSNIGFTQLPFNINRVADTFLCFANQLTSLEGCPKYVGGYFDCSDNPLTTIEHCPEHVGTDFFIEYSELDHLDHLPKHLGGGFFCIESPLGSVFTGVGQDFLEAFKTYKVIKGNELSSKRLRYVMGLFDKSIDVERIAQHYKIV